MLRRCGACREFKSVYEFAWRRRSKGQRDNYCRPCRAHYKQLHYTANKQRYVANATRRKQRIAGTNLGRLLEFFTSHPCIDCGETDPLVLEFDHIGEKSFTIGKAIRDRSWDAIENEIAECEVVCANCHRRRTARRGGYARALRLEGNPGSSATLGSGSRE